MFRSIVLYVTIYYVWLALLSVAAWCRGEWPERAAIWMLAGASALTLIARSAAATKYQHVEVGVTVVDLALLAGFVGVALRSDRWWPLCAAALQAVTILGHLAKAIIPEMSRMAYALMIGLPAYPLVTVLTIGLILAARRGAARS